MFSRLNCTLGCVLSILCRYGDAFIIYLKETVLVQTLDVIWRLGSVRPFFATSATTVFSHVSNPFPTTKHLQHSQVGHHGISADFINQNIPPGGHTSKEVRNLVDESRCSWRDTYQTEKNEATKQQKAVLIKRSKIKLSCFGWFWLCNNCRI